MAGPYDIYPAVDPTFQFPPEVRARAAASAELRAVLDTERAKTDLDRANALQVERATTNSDRALALTAYETAAVVAARGRTKSYPDLSSMIADRASLNNGDLAIVGRFQYSNGILHRASTWMKQGGILSPVGDILVEASDRAGTFQSATAIANQVQGSLNVGTDIFYNQVFRNVVTPHTCVWDATVMAPPKGLLLKKAWAQWNFGPAPRGDWWDMPMDTWHDPYGLANYGNGFTAPADGWYRAYGRFGYQQSVREERIIAAMQKNGGGDVWSGLPMFIWGDTPAPFSINFYANRNDQWRFRVYHSGQGDLYAISGNSSSESSANSHYHIDFLGNRGI